MPQGTCSPAIHTSSKWRVLIRASLLGLLLVLFFSTKHTHTHTHSTNLVSPWPCQVRNSLFKIIKVTEKKRIKNNKIKIIGYLIKLGGGRERKRGKVGIILIPFFLGRE